MKKYLVGGAVRSKLLGENPSDLDYVITGVNEQYMLTQGYKKVGKSFPVYLDTEGNEIALARVEQSTGDKYTDFTCDVEKVTIEMDLHRRDLTMNAIAFDGESYIDPYGGVKDIQNKIIRHTSNSFKEDPLRVLRVARFKCKLGLDWKIDPSTKVLIYNMRESLNSLTPERVWKEVEKVLSYDNSNIFFATLLELNVLHIIFPSIFQLVVTKEGTPHHREFSVFEHTMKMLEDSPKDTVLKLASLYHDIGKPSCIRYYGHSGGHDKLELVETLIDIHIPTTILKKVLFLISNHIRVHMLEMRPSKRARFYLSFKRDREQLERLLMLADLDTFNRVTVSPKPTLPKTKMLKLFDEIVAYSPKEWINKQDKPPKGAHVKQHVLGEIVKMIKDNKWK
jgi:tRNA nucleotidyltransferase (CCA-adding enzyme)